MTVMRRKSPRLSPSRVSGQALVEFVPVMLILMVLIFAVIDFSRALWQLQVISGLVREGANLAARNTPLSESAAAVVNDGAVLNLGSGANGKVIITAVTNRSGAFVITDQYITGGLKATSRIGRWTGSGTDEATIPPTSGSVTLPQLNETLYVTEVYARFSPITPIGAFVKYTMPSTLYDVAYF